MKKTLLFTVIALLLSTQYACREDETPEPDTGTEGFSFTLDRGLFTSGTFAAVVVSDQNGNVLLDSLTEDLDTSEDIELTVDKTTEQKVCVTLASNPQEVIPGLVFFGVTSYYDLQVGCTVDNGSLTTRIGRGSRQDAVITISGVDTYSDLQIPNRSIYREDAVLNDNTLRIEYDKSSNADIFFYLRINGQDELRYFHAPSTETQLEIDASDLKSGLQQVNIEAPFSEFSEGHIYSRIGEFPSPNFLYLGEDEDLTANAEAGNISFFTPADVNIKDYYYQLQGSKYGFEGVYETMPATLENLNLDLAQATATERSFDVEVQSDFDVFQYLLSYSPEAAPGEPTYFGSWSIVGSSSQPQMQLPEFSDEIRAKLPVIDEMGSPTSGRLTAYQFKTFDLNAFQQSPQPINSLYYNELSDGYRSARQFFEF